MSWIDALRMACAESSQAKVARRIGYSSAAVCQVLSGKYTGNLAAVEHAVRGALMNICVVRPSHPPRRSKQTASFFQEP